MRILVRIAHDARDRDIIPTNLASNVAVEILRRDNVELAVGGMAVRHRGEGQSQRKKQSDHGFHEWDPF
jgi:hypothetical protein